MKRFRQGFIFVLLAGVLGLLLLFKNRNSLSDPQFTLRERLPVSDILVRAQILELSKQIGPMLFKYKLPIREFASADFLLSQGKQFGINIQSEAYLFLNRDLKEWGFLISLNDSSKMVQLVDRFRKNTPIADSSRNKIRILFFSEPNVYLCYQKSYALLYFGNQLNQRLDKISGKGKPRIEKEWQHFFHLNSQKSNTILAYSEADFLKSWGFDYALVTPKTDSITVHFNGLFHTPIPHGIHFLTQAKGLPNKPSDTKAIELHVDSTFKHQAIAKNLTAELNTFGKKIGFPTGSFLKAWDGNLSFREGGRVNSVEKIIVTEFDENFNPKETVRLQPISVPGYAVVFGSNAYGKAFLNALFEKGILRNESNKLRFLYAPLLTMKQDKNQFFFSSVAQFPKLTNASGNYVHWTQNNAPFSLDLMGCGADYFVVNMDCPATYLIYEWQKKMKSRKKGSS